MVADAGVPLDGVLRLQASGRALAQRLSAVLDALPETTTGWDARKVVRVDIDRMSQLTAIVVSDRWSDTLRPNDLAPAVMQAKGAADAAYSEILDAATARVDAGDAAPTGAVDDDLIERARTFGEARSPIVLAENVLDAIPRDETVEPPAADEWIVETPLPYSLTVENGVLVGVRIDAGWASSRSAAAINTALASALADTATPDPDEPASAAGADSELVELLASLVTIADGFGSPTGRN